MATYLRISNVGDKSGVRIAGDVKATGHDGWIELNSFKFGSEGGKGGGGSKDGDGDGEDEEVPTPSQQRSRRKGKGADTGADPSDRFRKAGLSFQKRAGTDSVAVINWALKGEVYDLQIDCCREDGQVYMSILVGKARVLEFEQEADGEEVAEDITVLFDTIAFEAMPYTKEGTKKPKTTASTKPVPENVAARAPIAGGSGKGVGKRVAHTHAHEVVERAAEQFGIGDELDEFIQQDRVLKLDKIGGIEFVLGGFVGSEELSGLFEFRLEVTSENRDVKASDVIGQAASFRIEDDGEIDPDRKSSPREFHGIVAEMYAGQKTEDFRDYTLVVVPWLWLLTKRTDCRIFQKKSVVEIVESVFQGLGFSDFEKSSVRGTYPKLEYCVQYRETDFAFVSRLLEENGIFYFFRFAKGSHKLILADASVVHTNCEQKDVVQSSGATEDKQIREWTRHLSHVSGKVRYRDYNHTTPSETLEAEAKSVVDLPKIDKYELYDYPGRYPNVSDGSKRAKARIEAEEVSHCVIDGTSGCDSFAAGSKFTIEDHEIESEVGQEFVLTGVVHKTYVMPDGDLKARLYYTNDFECLPKAVTFRPAPLTPWPVVRGPQTAIVVGKSSEEIDPDKYGSVKVQFPWDRLGKKDENSSCFIRVAQPISGKNWGAITLPRIGQEVVVEFLEGDPDRPLITGCVYNEENQPPYALPANKTQTGFKSRSSKEGKAENFNELRFEDKKGSEQVYFHAEKDFERIVENDDKLTVGKEDKGNQTITIEKDRTLTVNKGNETTTIKEGDRSATIEKGKETLTVKQGDRAVVVETGNDTHDVKKGNRTVTVDTGNDTHDVKKGNRAVTVDMGNDTLTIKMGNQTTKLNLGKSSTEAMQGIELKVGANSIKIDQSGITLKGMMVKLDGSIQTDIKGLICQINGSAMLKAGGGITMIG